MIKERERRETSRWSRSSSKRERKTLGRRKLGNTKIGLAVYKTQKLEYTRHNFACGSVWVCNLVSDVKGGTQTEGV
jgi:hypothetical protein